MSSNQQGANTPLDLKNLSEEDIKNLIKEGIPPEQLAEFAKEQGQPIPEIIQKMISSNSSSNVSNSSGDGASNEKDSYPAMMNVETYQKYKNDMKSKAKNNSKMVYDDNKSSNLMDETVLRNMKQTQGSFFVGVNLFNLFNEFYTMIKHENKKNNTKAKKGDNIFKRVGEYLDMDFDETLLNMGYRGSSVPLVPEKELTENASFLEILNESKKYADMGYGGKITPMGLLIMTRMLYKYRKNNAQWLRVATILELIYKYFNNNQSRNDFFKSKDDISILSLMELEEFYNTDHIFMTDNELVTFKKSLDFYKYNPNIDIKQELQKLLSKPKPII